MRFLAWCKEVGLLLARGVPTLLIVMMNVLAAVLLTSTVGQSAAAAQGLADSVNGAGAKSYVAESQVTDHLNRNKAGALRGASGIDAVLLTTVPTDVVDVQTMAGPVPAWGVDDGVREAVTLVDGRWPEAGEMMISRETMQRLGWEAYYAGVRSRQGDDAYAVVGVFAPREGFEYLAEGLVHLTPEPDGGFAKVQVMLESADQWDVQGDVIRATVTSGADPQTVSERTPTTLADLQADIESTFGQHAANMFYSVLGASAVIIFGIVFGESVALRRDIGRRRILGASRGTIIGLLLARVACASAVGAALGVVGALVWLRDSLPPATFLVGTGVLCLVTSVVAAFLPTLIAVFEDPVKVVRSA